jgi:hypothetical protein
MVASAVACGGTPDDFEGASNTDPNTAPNACAELRSCCLALDEASQGMCLAGANSGDDSECGIAVSQYRNDGTCR